MIQLPAMGTRTDPQLVLSFARPKRKRGGLGLDDYQALVDWLRGDATLVAAAFKLPGFDLDADRADARDRYGLCFSDGRIRVRLVNVRTGRMLKYSALIDTVVHELAHLRYMDHGPRWESLYRRMLEWCRKKGIYQPRVAAAAASAGPASNLAPGASAPVQLSLFARRPSPTARACAAQQPVARADAGASPGRQAEQGQLVLATIIGTR